MAYASSLGRWTQQDPAGYVDGSNLYGYVLSNPVGLTDPYGETPKDNRFGLSDQFWEWWEREGKAQHGGQDIKDMDDAMDKLKDWNDQGQPGGSGSKRNKPQRGGKRGRGSADTKLINLIGLATCEAACAIAYNNAVQAADQKLNSYLGSLKLLKGKDLDQAIEAATDAHYYEVLGAATKYAACGLACLCPFDLPLGND